jgi:hypothetical protein
MYSLLIKSSRTHDREWECLSRNYRMPHTFHQGDGTEDLWVLIVGGTTDKWPVAPPTRRGNNKTETL